uniref:Hexosyltransferase n=1 Tax=Schistocephalus solidus TaxID=70667 RepID=A0A0X3NYZ4_SCHSO
MLTSAYLSLSFSASFILRWFRCRFGLLYRAFGSRCALILLSLTIVCLQVFGVLESLRAIPFQEAILQYRRSEAVITYQREIKSLAPQHTQNSFHPNFPYLHTPSDICFHASDYGRETLPAVVLIKSTVSHQEHRAVIRATWMREMKELNIPVVFLLGAYGHGNNSDIDKEQETYGEIVQQDFIDHYDNNTYKAIMGLKWASAYCPQANFVVSLDDDFYANPRLLNQLLDHRTALLINQPYQLVGHVYENASPYRTWFSKWYVSLADYPWTHWPPYPAAGAYVTSMQLIRLMALEADHVAYLRFDDVFVGFLALKLNVQPEHDDRFMLSTRTCRIELHKAIACHTVGSPSTVLWLWEHRLDHNRRRLS